MIGDVCTQRERGGSRGEGGGVELERESGCCVLDDLEMLGEVSVEANIESIAEVQFAGYQGLGDCSPGVEREPLEDLFEAFVGVETG